MQAQVTRKKNPMPKIFGMNATVMRIARMLNAKQIRETTRLTGRTDTVPDIYGSLPREAIWLMVGGTAPFDKGTGLPEIDLDG